MGISENKKDKHIILKIVVIILLVIIGVYCSFVFFMIKRIENDKRLGIAMGNLGPALVKYMTGIDISKKGVLTQEEFSQILKNAKYIRIEINDRIRQEIKDTGKVCVPFFSESVQILSLQGRDKEQ